jgi:HTH-type transcriptional regulator/antitoxin HipB
MRSRSSADFRVTVPRDLGAAIKHYRTSAGLTQAQSAESMGVTQSYVSRLESGEFGTSLSQALRLLRIVGCEVVVRRTGSG